MKNLFGMLQQAQALKEKMEEVQRRLAATEIEGSAGAGLVTITLSGRGEPRRVVIDPSLMRPGEPQIVADLVLQALTDARARQESAAQAAMAELTGGLALPPGLLPL